jgi:hypothetical protein
VTTARLAAFAADSWKYLIEHPGHDDVPVPRPTLPLIGKLFADRGIIALMSGTSGFWARPGEVDRDVRREVARAVDLYGERGWLEQPSSYHREPPPLESVALESVRGWWRYDHMRFESGYEPLLEDPGRDRWLAYRANRTAHAWILRHRDETRPWLVTIHGYGMGHPVMDFHGIRAEYLHRRLGMNVVAYVMPLHGPRKSGPTRGSKLFTGGVANLVHGEAQAMWDLRRIIGWVRAKGATAVGVQGLSLGGYTTALLASLEEDLACAIAGIPAADFIDLFRRHMPREVEPLPPELERFWRDARRVLRVVSPLAIPPRVPRERRYIFAGLVDRLVPPAVARSLWEHWERPRIAWYAGSHVSFLLEPEVRRFLEEAFADSGLVRG